MISFWQIIRNFTFVKVCDIQPIFRWKTKIIMSVPITKQQKYGNYSYHSVFFILFFPSKKEQCCHLSAVFRTNKLSNVITWKMLRSGLNFCCSRILNLKTVTRSAPARKKYVSEIFPWFITPKSFFQSGYGKTVRKFRPETNPPPGYFKRQAI